MIRNPCDFGRGDCFHVSLLRARSGQLLRPRVERRDFRIAIAGAQMISATTFLRAVIAAVISTLAGLNPPAYAAEEFPFGFEMTLDVAPQPGSKRRPNL